MVASTGLTTLQQHESRDKRQNGDTFHAKHLSAELNQSVGNVLA